MPVSKTQRKWVEIIAEEFGISEEAIWTTNMSEEKFFVYIWTAKLTKTQFESIASTKSSGGHLSKRGKLARFLKDLNAEGWLTKVEPSEAQPHDLFPLMPSTESLPKFCSSCGDTLFEANEIQLQKCKLCAPKFRKT